MNAYLPILVAMIEFIGALIIAAAAIKSIITLIQYKSISSAKIHMANGAIMGLDFKLAATLLKTLTLTSWENIAMFVSVYVIRMVLKQSFRIGKPTILPLIIIEQLSY